MLRKIIPIVLIFALIAGAAGYYLFGVDMGRGKQSSETSVVRIVGYTVVFVDSESKIIPGVMCNVCDETTCTMLTSDKDGVIEMPGEDFPYEVQVLKAPEGFKLPDEPVIVDGSEKLVVCTLEKE